MNNLCNSKTYNILLVEDDLIIAKTIMYYLKECQIYNVIHAKTAGEAISEIRHNVDLILMDIMLPDISGIDLCQKIREYTYCPIIFISAIDDDNTIIKALDTGGDDYLVKPFNNKVLNARILSNLRRSERLTLNKQNTSKFEFPDFSINPIEHTVKTKDHTTTLAPMEFAILMVLISHEGQTISSEDLYQEVWNRPSYGDLRTIPVHIFNIRKKIGEHEDNPKYIKTVRGIGYIFSSNKD